MPLKGFAPPRFRLRVGCSAVELQRQRADFDHPRRSRTLSVADATTSAETKDFPARLLPFVLPSATPRYRTEPSAFSARRFHLVSLSGKCGAPHHNSTAPLVIIIYSFVSPRPSSCHVTLGRKGSNLHSLGPEPNVLPVTPRPSFECLRLGSNQQHSV